MRHFFSVLAVAATVVLGTASALAADPTIDQVYQAASAGRYAQANQMMDQVLHDHPNSGKAHFVEAELLAKEGRVANARTELATAERLEPGLPFAKPAAAQELKSLLSADAHHAGSVYAPAPAVSRPSFPFGLIILLLAVITLVAFFVRRRSQPVVQAAPAAAPYGYGSGPTYYGNGPAPMSPSGGGMGSGILGGLATGAAMGAGVVAGEALMHRIMDGSGQPVATQIPSNNWMDLPTDQQTYDMGGNDFGITDDSSWDDGSGGGGDDWN